MPYLHLQISVVFRVMSNFSTIKLIMLLKVIGRQYCPEISSHFALHSTEAFTGNNHNVSNLWQVSHHSSSFRLINRGVLSWCVEEGFNRLAVVIQLRIPRNSPMLHFGCLRHLSRHCRPFGGERLVLGRLLAGGRLLVGGRMVGRRRHDCCCCFKRKS